MIKLRKLSDQMDGSISGSKKNATIPCYAQSMSNPDLLNQADRILRPVLIKLAEIPWLKVTGCCAGHQPEESVWFETEIRGISGLQRMMEWLRVLEGKLIGTNCRTDCLVSYSEDINTETVNDDLGNISDDPKAVRTPYGWFPITIETFWPPKEDWRRGQALIIEALLSSVEEFGDQIEADCEPDGALNYCPYCSSSFVRLDKFVAAGQRYKCRDCNTSWTMIDPTL